MIYLQSIGHGRTSETILVAERPSERGDYGVTHTITHVVIGNDIRTKVPVVVPVEFFDEDGEGKVYEHRGRYAVPDGFPGSAEFLRTVVGTPGLAVQVWERAS